MRDQRMRPPGETDWPERVVADTRRRPVDVPAQLGEFGDTLTDDERAEWMAALQDARGGS